MCECVFMCDVRVRLFFFYFFFFLHLQKVEHGKTVAVNTLFNNSQSWNQEVYVRNEKETWFNV